MESKTVWTAEYRGIGYQIEKFKLGEKDAWTFYLYLALDSIPEDIRERFWLEPKKDGKRVYYSYSDEGLISGIDWHYGCTWYSKETQDGEPRVIKIGCDYQHYSDEGCSYNEHYLEMDAKHAIDSFLEMVPNILRRCQWDGRYVPESEGALHGDIWYSNEGFKLREESCKQWREKQGSTKA